jgi:hypothetical protein
MQRTRTGVVEGVEIGHFRNIELALADLVRDRHRVNLDPVISVQRQISLEQRNIAR